MANVAPGIVTFGLGGDQSNLILGNILNLGFFKVEVGVGSPIGGSPFPGPGGSPIIGGSPIGGSPPYVPPVIPPIPPIGGGGGGSRPFAPGEIQTFYKPVEDSLYKPGEKKYPVTIKITFRGKVTEKYYLVGPKRGDIIITVLNLVNKVRDGISITVKNIRRVPSRIVAFIRNIRNKDED